MLTGATLAPTLILAIGAVDDLRLRKVRNWLVLALLVVAAVNQFVFFSWGGIREGLLGAVAGLAACLPLVLARVVGAGDMKLMVAFGLATSWVAALSVVLWSLLWGAILGVIRAIVAGELTKLLTSTYSLATRAKTSSENLHRIPYTIALFFGWLTYLTLNRLPGGWP